MKKVVPKIFTKFISKTSVPESFLLKRDSSTSVSLLILQNF